jgi:hypothetical protein
MAVTLSGGNPTFTTGYQGGTIISGTAQASTSGTSIDFTSIPSWVKRVTVSFNGVSTSGTSGVLIQIGAGSVTTTGYVSSGSRNSSTVSTGSATNGFYIRFISADEFLNGVCLISTLGSNIWAESHSLGSGSANVTFIGGGAVTLSGTLDRVRITTVNGTDTFDAGSINILYE